MTAHDQSFGKYKLLARLAQEPTAEVFKALNTETNQTVILRLIHAAVSAHPRIAQLFEERAEIERFQVEHPNLLALVDFGEVGQRRFFCVEYVEGKSLARRMKEGKVPPEEAMDILRQTAEGLRALHQRRIYHGDVKPANILLTTDRHGRLLVKVSLVDLSVVTAEGMVSIFGELVGTPKYLAPEQIRGEKPSAQSDIFSLGICAYEMLSGQPPFHSETALGYLHKNVHEAEKPLKELDPNIPVEFSLIVQKMMAKSPQVRYRSCQNLLDDLDRAERSIVGGYVARLEPGTDSAFAPPPTAVQAPSPEAMSKKKVALVAGVVVGLGLMILAMVSVGLRLFGPSGATGAGRVSPEAPPPRKDERLERNAYQQLLKARTAETKGDVKTAAKEYKTLASKYAGTAAAQDAQAKLAELAKRTQAPSRPAAAPSELQKAFDALDSEAKRLVARSEFALAAKKYEAFALAHEGTPEGDLAREQLPSVLFGWAETLARGGQEEQALAKYVEIQEKYKDTEWAERAKRSVPAVALQHARRLERNQDFEKALKVFQNLAENYQDTEAGQTAAKRLPDVILAAGRKCLEQNQCARAIELLKSLLEKHGGTPAGEVASRLLPEAELRKAEILLEAGKTAEADAALTEVCQKHPNSEAAAKARLHRAEILFANAQELIKAGKTQEGLATFDDLARTYPESPLIAAHQAEMNELRAKISARPDAESLYREGVDLIAKGKAEDGFTRLERIARDFPDTPWAAKARDAMAKTVYEEAMKLRAAGKEKEAADLLADLTSQFPDTEWARKASSGAEPKQPPRVAEHPEGMVLVEAGPFTMGSDESEIRALLAGEEEADATSLRAAMLCETPRHEVNLPAFYIDKTEVTNAQYLKFVEETGHPAPTNWVRGKPLPGKENDPVVYVSFEDAEAYAKWAGKRLPTEAEWEKAARGADGRAYPWGRKFAPDKANFLNPAQKATTPVGSFPEGASPAGCLDMVGNVAEWTASWFEPYPGNKFPQPEYGRTHRVVRGGAFNDTLLVYGRCASRRPMEPTAKSRGVGFRCVKDAK